MTIPPFKSFLIGSILVFSLFNSHCLFGHHAIGADIKWEFMGNNKYKVTTRVFRDCNSTSLTNIPITFSGNCSGISSTTQTMSNSVDITPLCASQCSRCNSRSCNFQFGIEYYDLTTIIDVTTFKKNGCCEVNINWKICCRNGNNVGGPNEGFNVKAEMNVCLGQPDNSPVIEKDPNIIMCLTRDYYSSFAAKDIDTTSNGEQLDSLVYSIVDPLNTSNQKVSWQSPYSAQKPLSYLGFPRDFKPAQFPFGIHLDSETGAFMVRPTKLEQTTFAIKVEEYRAGKKIGEITRDFLVVVIKCPTNNAPIISGFGCAKPVIKNFDITVCPGKEICLDICVTDNDAGDSVSLTWNTGIPDAQFNILNTGSKREKAQFCWTPEKKHIRTEPYLFAVNANDHACPVENESVKIFKVYVKEAYELKTDIKSNGLCGDYQLTAYTADSIANQEWKWYLNDTTLISSSTVNKNNNSYTLKLLENGTYPIKIRSTRSGCIVEVGDTIKPNFIKRIMAQTADTTLCKENRFKYILNAKGGYGKLNYQWQIPSDSMAGTTNAIDTIFPRTANIAGVKRQVYYQITDSAKCTVSDSFQVWHKFNAPISIQQDTTFCGDQATKTLPIHSPLSLGIWTGTGVKNNAFFPKFLNTGNYDITYYAEDTNQCYTDTAKFTIAAKTPLDLGNDVTACPEMDHSIQLKAKPTSGTWSGKYVDNQGKYSASKNTIGTETATYTFTNTDGCVSKDSIKINTLNYQPFIEVGNDTMVCVNEAKMPLAGNPSGGTWTGNYVSNNGGYFYDATKTKIDDIHVLHYRISDSIGCVNRDSIQVKTQEVMSISAQDVSHCLNGLSDTITLKASPTGGIWKGKSLFGASGELIIDSSFIGSNSYKYQFTNKNGCVSTKDINVIIREKPYVLAGLDDTLCISKDSQYIFKPNVFGGLWSGPGLSTNNGHSVVLNNNFNGVNHYTYSYTDAYGCSGSDDLNLYVGNLNKADFIPSKTVGMAPVTIDFDNQSTNGDFYYWNFGNGLTSQAFEPSTNYNTEGQYMVTLLAIDSLSYCQTMATKTINVEHNTAVEKTDNSSMNIYPNPSSGSVFIKNNSVAILHFEIRNQLGQLILSTNCSGNNEYELGELTAGTYFIHFQNQLGNNGVKKVVIY